MISRGGGGNAEERADVFAVDLQAVLQVEQLRLDGAVEALGRRQDLLIVEFVEAEMLVQTPLCDGGRRAVRVAATGLVAAALGQVAGAGREGVTRGYLKGGTGRLHG